ncbi:hypothetical protein [Spirosoma sp.]|uniref:hypothetical protein n=1 Tax=Spirosoma sp. TaxID=1899569 RepID=UPI003B3A8B79
MKKSLLFTDGSVDTALSLNRWLEQQTEAIDLTIVYAFSLPQASGQPLKAATYHQAKQEASERLTYWLNFIPTSGPNHFKTEILPGDPKLVLSIYLLLRRYDYLIIDTGQTEVLSAFMACRSQVSTQVRCLSASEPFLTPELVREFEHTLSCIPATSWLAA